MKHIAVALMIVATFGSTLTLAEEPLPKVQLADLAVLAELDKSGNKVGYGLCVQTVGPAEMGRCASDGSLGYGLCVQAVGVEDMGRCASDGSVGYGLCVQSVGATGMGKCSR